MRSIHPAARAWAGAWAWSAIRRSGFLALFVLHNHSRFRYSSDVELGKFLGSIDLIPEAYRAISETNLAYELLTTSSGIHVLAFNCSPEYTTRFLEGEFDLIKSENLKVVDFISTRVNSSFSINEAAVELFQHLEDDIKELESKHINTPLIITGSGLGGYLAILSALRLHHAIDVEELNGSKETKRPICITFGTPLVGDANLQKAIAERPKWKSSFLNVVAKNDPLASFFSSNTDYKPFGTFLFCIESGGVTAFEDQGSIMLVLNAMKSSGNLQVYDYTNILSLIRKKVLFRGVSVPNEFNLNPMRESISLELKIDVLDDTSNVKIAEMENTQKEFRRMSEIMFYSEVELGKFLGSVDVIPEAYGAISETNLIYELHTTRSGINVLAFECSSDDSTQLPKTELDLLPSEIPHVLDFISTKVNPKFSINKTAIELFLDLGDDLKELENKHINKSLIITGSGVGGYLAILSTLRLHHAIDVEESKGTKNTKRPICITFGSPLVGDVALKKAIVQRPQWKSSFLHVVAKNDPVASFFSSESSYKPFGTFLFCQESGGHAAFEDQNSILLVLDTMKSSNAGQLQTYDYTNILSSIRKKILFPGVSDLGELNLNPLRGGITLQLKEAGVLDKVSNKQIDQMEQKQKEMIRKKNMVNAYDPTKKLNDMKISLTYMEWYMKTRREEGGYYDSYKNAKGKEEMERKYLMVKHQRGLNQYWKKVVEDKDIMPQKEGSKLRKRWLYGGTNYRRIVEPLDIAEYYEKGNKNYINNRPNHYKLLEKWSNEEKDPKSNENKRNKAASLTEDSCFWAHVEEALILLKDLVNGLLDDTEKDNKVEQLKQFEAYLMCEIQNYSLSPDVFIEGSSLMKWWDRYKAHKGDAYASEFANYMNSVSGSYTLYH